MHPATAPVLFRVACAVLVVAGSSLSGPGPASAQSASGSEAWFGVPLPTGLEVPPQFSVLGHEGFSASPAPVPPGEEVDTELEGELIQRWLQDIVGFSEQSRANGELMWGRVSGFPAASATAEWVAQRYRDAGLSQVAVQRRRPTGGAASQRGAIRGSAQELFERGAVAVLNYIDQPGNMHVRDFSGCGEVCFNIGGDDGGFLRSVTERAAGQGSADALRVRLYLDADTRSGLTAQNVVGIVPGDSDEIVIVNAHLDGWFGAAGIMATGLRSRSRSLGTSPGPRIDPHARSPSWPAAATTAPVSTVPRIL